mmetsp:Transcript_28608/g.46141  ORF Transcript_28608/g.46141 Transcript_28608/m.46141 type:complete len:423 (+) Transcript_28608:174-1442(+)
MRTLLLFFSIFGVFCSGTGNRLNVLLVIIDDFRAETGSYGSNQVDTPNLDQFASESVQFNRAYTQEAICGPSRASLLTAKLPSTLGYYTHIHPLQERRVLATSQVLTKYFQNQGYTVSGTSKIVHWVTNNKRYVQNYNKQSVQVDDNACGDKAVCEIDDKNSLTDFRALVWAKQQLANFRKSRGKKKWMLVTGFRRPHTKFRAPKAFYDRSSLDRISVPDNQEIPTNAPWQAHRPMCQDLLQASELKNTRFRSGGSRILDTPAAKMLRLGYFTCIEWIDFVVGELLRSLKTNGFEDNTLVVITSDHGWSLGEHGSWCKGGSYDLATRVPMWIRHPSREREGVQENRATQLVDLYPTIAELAGVPLTTNQIKKLDGRSFADLVLPNTETHPTVINTLKRTPQIAGHNFTFPLDAAIYVLASLN